MSYVPKYVLKRMIKQDALKKVEGGVEFTMINLVATIPVDQIPGSPLDILEIKINGEQLSREEMEKIVVEFNEQKVKLPNIMDVGVIPVNSVIKFFLPVEKYNAGDEIKVEIDVPIVNVHVEFTRTIQ
ncbi:MAG: hypothetical protein ACTSWN_00585 [Promethearchaeota archaeon]